MAAGPTFQCRDAELRSASPRRRGSHADQCLQRTRCRFSSLSSPYARSRNFCRRLCDEEAEGANRHPFVAAGLLRRGGQGGGHCEITEDYVQQGIVTLTSLERPDATSGYVVSITQPAERVSPAARC